MPLAFSGSCAEPLGGRAVALRDYAERDIPEILIAHQDDPRLYVLAGEDRPPSGAELGRAAEREAAERAGRERAHAHDPRAGR